MEKTPDNAIDLSTPVRFEASAQAVRAWVEKADGDKPEVRKIEMLASGTKVDTYDDRMSLNALKNMQEGMIGKDFLPDHMSEWYDVMGFITEGRIEDEQYYAVAELAPVSGDAASKADALFSAVQAGRKIGVSIAGWIKRVMFEEEGGRQIRVIDRIECDHIAATRCPAYRDAMIVGIAKSLDAAKIVQSNGNRACLLTKGEQLATLLNRLIDEKATEERPRTDIQLISAAERDGCKYDEEFNSATALSVKSVVRHMDHMMALASENTDWSFDTDEQDAVLESGGWDLYRDVHTWYKSPEDDIPDPPETKDAYKLPHHKMIDSEAMTVWRGVSAAMAALLGARGGVDIPDDERRGVYDHLAEHYMEFEKEPPDFKSVQAWWAELDRGGLTDEERGRCIDAFLNPKSAPPAKKEIQKMTPEELQALLNKQNEAIAAAVAAANNPMAETLKAIVEANKTLVEQMTAQAQAVKTAQERIERIESQPVRKGLATLPIGAEPPAVEVYDDPIEEIKRQAETDEFKEFARKNPAAALKAYVEVIGPALFDLLRAEGSLSGVDSALEGMASWQSK